MVELGQQFGLYVIKEILSARDSYVCYRAEDPFFNREVALKVYPVELFTLGERQSRLEKMFENLADLDHPSIAPIYDSGLEENNVYYTTEYYSGGSLAAQISEPMATPQLLRLASELTQGLAYALEHGFSPGRLCAEKIYFAADGSAVIGDFAVASSIEEILASSEPAADSSAQQQACESVAAALASLGELLLRATIGTFASTDEPIDGLIAQVADPKLKKLFGRLLLADESRFTSYAELLEELANFNQFAPLLTSKSDRPKELAAYSAAEKSQESSGDEQPDAKLRRLVAENNSLLQRLDKAVYNRNVAENKVSEKDRELADAKAASVRLQEEANVAWELVAGQKYERWRPVAWTVGGFVLGFILSGSFGYYYSEQTRNELLAKMKANEELIKTAAWRPASPASLEPVMKQLAPAAVAAQGEVTAPPAVALKPVTTTATQPETDAPPQIVVDPVKEVPQQWWPAGNEFSPTAAIPIEQIKAALGLQAVVTDDGLSDSLRQEVLAVVGRWADSWSKQDIGQYFSLYSENYQPELGRSQEEWRNLRRQRLTTPQYIELNIDNISFRQINENRIQVKLQQRYRSDFYQDQILKSINLIKENGSWRILMERSLGMLEDAVGG